MKVSKEVRLTLDDVMILRKVLSQHINGTSEKIPGSGRLFMQLAFVAMDLKYQEEGK